MSNTNISYCFLGIVEAVRIPITAAPLLLAAGTLSVENSVNLPVVLLLVVVASLLADSFWFLIGRRYGASALRFLCRCTLETSACVHKTETAIKKQRAGTLLVAKFIPGLNLMAPPMAGQRAMRYSAFLLYDAAGAFVWGASLVFADRYFGDVIGRNLQLFYRLAHVEFIVCVLVIALWFLYRAWKKWSILRQFRTTRVAPEYLKSKLDQGEPVFIIDLRSPRELKEDALMLPGAVHIMPGELIASQVSIPQDREIFTYCNCPNEKTSVRAALALQKIGRTRIHPVRGGFGA